MNEYPYLRSYDPALPICELRLAVPATGRSVTTQAIIDTGADATLVPVVLLDQIGARRVFGTGLRSQWGERRRVFLYLADVHIGQVLLPGMYVVGDEIGQETILGRNVLNRLRLLLDGPAALTRVSP